MSVAYPSEEWFALALAAIADQGHARPGIDARIQFAAGPHHWVEVIAGGRITEWRLGTVDDPDIEVRLPLEAALGGITGAISGTDVLREATVRDPSRTPDLVAPSPMDLGDQPELRDLPTIPGASVEVQYEYRNGPFGPVSFGLSFAGGQVAGMCLGRLGAADVTVSCSFLQMARVRRGDIAILDVLTDGGTVAGEEGPLALLGGLSESPEFRRAEMACGRSGLALGVLGDSFPPPLPTRGHHMPNIHVIPDGDRWNVKEENGAVVSTHDTQAEAEQAGKTWLRANGGGEVFTHRDEGEFSRIRKGDAV